MADNGSRKVIGGLWQAVRQHPRRVTAAVILLVLAKVAGVFVPLVLKAVVDRFSAPQSLAAVAPVSYLAAAALLAQLHDAAGERVVAYGVLATAWATLGDLLGADVAASWVRPLLLALSLQWGDAAFAEAKARHDAQRRARRAGEGGIG